MLYIWIILFIYYYFFPICNFYILAFAYAKTHSKIPLQIYFVYLNKKKIYIIFKTCCVISLLLSTKFRLYCDFKILYSSNTFSTYYGLTYPFRQDKGKYSMVLQVMFVHFLAVIIDFCGELAVVMFLQFPGVWEIIYCFI